MRRLKEKNANSILTLTAPAQPLPIFLRSFHPPYSLWIRKSRRTWLAALLVGLCLTFGSPAPASHEQRLVARLKQGEFLFANPELRDPNFFHSVVLLVNYEKGGAMGLIINKPTEISLNEALPDVKGIGGQALSVFFGGPVSRNQMLVLLRPEHPFKETQKVFKDVYYTGSKDVLIEMLGRPGAQKKVRVYAGYTGWAPGQLEHEVSRGDWIIGNADAEMIFSEDPSKSWPEVFKLQEQIEIHGPHDDRNPDRREQNALQMTWGETGS